MPAVCVHARFGGCRAVKLFPRPAVGSERHSQRRGRMNNIIYLVGLVVVVIAVLTFFGLR
jgi:hypothetical protein